jgi:hypothetical protein
MPNLTLALAVVPHRLSRLLQSRRYFWPLAHPCCSECLLCYRRKSFLQNNSSVDVAVFLIFRRPDLRFSDEERIGFYGRAA